MTVQPSLFDQRRNGKRLSPAEKFQRWMGTVEGRELYAIVEHRALAQANNGAKRVEIGQIWSDVRKDHKKPMDHDLRSQVARKLLADHPLALAGKIHVKKAKGE